MVRHVRFLALAAATVLLTAVISRVSAVTSPMPYRPGYGLGSWVPPEVVAGMKQEAYARSAILLSEQMDAAATSLARELKLATNPVRNPLSNQQEIPPPMDEATKKRFSDEITAFRTEAWATKLSSYNLLFNQMKAQIQELTAASAVATAGSASPKAFSTFAAGAQSPVIWDASQIDLLNRAYDSFSIGSTFVRIDKVSQSSSTQSSSSTSSSNLSFEFFTGIGEASGSSSFASSAASRLEQTLSIKSVEQTLILSSFATHRKVKQFKTLTVEPQLLRDAWNYYHPEQEIPDPLHQTGEFISEYSTAIDQKADPNAPKISMISEIFQGSAMVGFVHFIKAETSSQTAQSSSATASMSASVKLGSFLDSMTGGTSFSRESASQMAQLASEAGLQIEFDMLCLGYIPSVKSQLVESSVMVAADMNVNKQTATDGGSKGQNEKQSNAKALIEGTIMTANEVVEKNPVLGIQTFMDAFDDYAKAAQERPDEIGAPVGLNVREWRKIDVMGALADQTFGNPLADARKRKQQQSGGGGGSSSSGSAASSGGGDSDSAAS